MDEDADYSDSIAHNRQLKTIQRQQRQQADLEDIQLDHEQLSILVITIIAFCVMRYMIVPIVCKLACVFGVGPYLSQAGQFLILILFGIDTRQNEFDKATCELANKYF